MSSNLRPWLWFVKAIFLQQWLKLLPGSCGGRVRDGFCYMGHGQYLVYSSKSSIFVECIIVFQVL